MSNSRRRRWADCAVCILEIRHVCRNLVGKPKWRDALKP